MRDISPNVILCTYIDSSFIYVDEWTLTMCKEARDIVK